MTPMRLGDIPAFITCGFGAWGLGGLGGLGFRLRGPQGFRAFEGHQKMMVKRKRTQSYTLTAQISQA